MQPATLAVERAATITAAPADIQPYLSDFNEWTKWSPWRDIDPNQATEMSDPAAGVGAWYSWSGNDDVGEGKMTITAASGTEVKHRIEFFAPFESTADTTISLKAEGDATAVTWAFESEQDFMAKAAAMFMDMDTMLGKDFEKGLSDLKGLSEAAAVERVAAEELAAETLDAAEPVEDGVGEPVVGDSE